MSNRDCGPHAVQARGLCSLATYRFYIKAQSCRSSGVNMKPVNRDRFYVKVTDADFAEAKKALEAANVIDSDVHCMYHLHRTKTGRSCA